MRYFLAIFLILSNCIFAFDREKRYTEPAEIVAIGSHPWIVKMTDSSGSFTGVLVSDRHILTTAHGLDSFPDGDCLKIQFKNAINPFSVKASKYIIHSKFDLSQFARYDFAIVVLDQAISLDKKGIELPEIDNTTYSLNDLYGIDYTYSAGYSGSDTLRKVSLEWLSVSNGVYQLSYAGIAEHGDSGSPLFYYLNGTSYLLGLEDSSDVVNGGPIYFEPISKYLEFIANNSNLEIMQKEKWKDVVCIFDVGVGVGAGLILSITAVYLIYKKFSPTTSRGTINP